MRAVIVGAGIIGLACANEFARNGASVTVVEQHLPGGGQTTRTGGGIRYAHGSTLNIALSLRSRTFWDEFERVTGMDPDYREVGHVFLTSDSNLLDSLGDQAETQRAVGLPSALRTRDEIVARWPWLRDLSQANGLHCEIGGYLDHHRVVLGYTRLLQSMNVRLELGHRVEALRVEGGTVRGVATSRGVFDCDLVINAAGPMAGRIASMADAPDPFVSRRHELIIVRPDRPVPPTTPWLIDMDRQVHCRPDGDGRALIGGFLGHDDPVEPSRLNGDYTDTWARAAATAAFGLTEPDCEIVSGWAGLYPGTVDYLPVIEETRDGMITAAGLSGTGIMHAPAVAEIAFNLSQKREASWIETGRLSSRRFSEKSDVAETTGF